MILTAGMAHPRMLIRQAVVALLIAANTAAAARVVATRVDDNRPGQLPSISVYTLRDEVDEDRSNETSPPELTRLLQLEITGWVEHTDQVHADDAMDNLAEQIEAAMDEAGPFLSGTAVDAMLANTTMQVVEFGSDPLVGVVVLTYLVTYRTTPTPPATPDDFLVADVTTEVPNGIDDDTVPAEDEFNVQEPTP